MSPPSLRGGAVAPLSGTGIGEAGDAAAATAAAAAAAEAAPGLNPFVNKTPKRSTGEKIKTAVALVLLVPARAVMFLVLFVLWYVFAVLSVLFLSERRLRERPLGKLRRLVRFPTRIFARLMLFVLGFYWISHNGRLVRKQQARIIVSNHTTPIDWLFFWAHAAVVPIVKWEYVKTRPMLRKIAHSMQAIFVYRTTLESPVRPFDEIHARSGRARRADWPRVLIFAEGTTTNGEMLLTYKHGAFAVGVPVQAAFLVYRWRHFDPSWVVGGPGAGALIFRMLCQFVNRLEVNWIPLKVFPDDTMKDPVRYSNAVRDTVASFMRRPPTSHSFQDMVLMNHAAMGALGGGGGAQLEVDALFGMNLQRCREILKQFALIDIERDGRVDRDGFAQFFLDRPPTKYTDQVFDLFDEEQSGFLDFNSFVAGFSLMLQQAPVEDVIRFAFETFDENGDGDLSREEFSALLTKWFGNMSYDEMMVLFDTIDTNHNGLIDYREFIAFAKDNPEFSHLCQFVDTAMRNKVSLHDSVTTHQHRQLRALARSKSHGGGSSGAFTALRKASLSGE